MHCSTATDYKRNGFAVVDSLVSNQQLQTLRDRLDAISSGAASFPKELIEFEPAATAGAMAIRKINGCAEHDAVFAAFAAAPELLDIVEQLIGPDIKLFGSQCFMKPPGGVEKPYHQDAAYFSIEPPEIVTCWTALDDATIDNGCLWVIPGSHRGGLLPHSQPWDVGDRVDMQIPDEQVGYEDEVPNELNAGSCSFHHCMLLHRSGANGTQRSRRGLAIHYMPSRSRWTHATKPQPQYRLLRGRDYDGCV